MADSRKEDETLDALQSSSGRAIRPTEAGREYQTQLKTKAYKHQLRELKQLSRQVVRQSGTEVELNPDISEEKAKKWIHNYISFSQTEYELCHLLPRAEVEQHSENHKMVLEEIDQVRMVVEGYLKSKQPQKTASASVAGSGVSTKSGLQLMQIEDQRKKAEVAARLSMLKARQELERQRQELQWKEEELALQTEIEIQQRQAEVTHKFKLELEGLDVLSDPDENVRMLQLLPKYIVNRWERVVDEALYEPRLGSSARHTSLGGHREVRGDVRTLKALVFRHRRRRSILDAAACAHGIAYADGAGFASVVDIITNMLSLK
ncbi:hypothetical protein FJT64_002522 [Amphibalanus amphitrite]|uniref:Uncharacterized protein n=1 Tax=Amphibalanus amphitrite TaxID=1232801 RepID=A0A6A4WU65_AMPAM|nr:hypothetical protein FJT64_002522 [Amphibalanus amphitrite]